MNRRNVAVVLLLAGALAVAIAATLSPAAPATPAVGLFGALRGAKSVGLRDLGDRYELSIHPRGRSGLLKLVEVGQRYIVVQDTRRNKIYIPLHSVKSIHVPYR